MTENIGPAELVARLLLAILLGLIAVLAADDLRVAAPAALAAIWLAGTAVTRRCPIYALLGRTSRLL